MGNDKPSNVDAWLDALDEEDGAALTQDDGTPGEVVRSALAINPALFADQREGDVQKAVAAAQLEGHQAAGKDLFADLGYDDIVKAILVLEQRFSEEKTQLQQRVAQLRTHAKSLPQRVLERLISTVLTHDPNMADDKTLRMLDEKRHFLQVIGFSVEKVVARQMQQEKDRR